MLNKIRFANKRSLDTQFLDLPSTVSITNEAESTGFRIKANDDGSITITKFDHEGNEGLSIEPHVSNQITLH